MPMILTGILAILPDGVSAGAWVMVQSLAMDMVVVIMTTGLIPIMVAGTIKGLPLADTMAGVTLTMEVITVEDTMVADIMEAVTGVAA